MPAQLVLTNGRIIPLTDDTCERVLRIVGAEDVYVRKEPAPDLETLMFEFRDLYGAHMPSTTELIEERALERARERRKLDRTP